jgi:hypothetical protein
MSKNEINKIVTLHLLDFICARLYAKKQLKSKITKVAIKGTRRKVVMLSVQRREW